jgi:adenylate cyclase
VAVPGTLTPQQFKAVRRGIIYRGVFVGGPVGAAISVYYAVWEPTFYGSRLQAGAENFGEFLGFMVLMGVLGDQVLKHWLAPHARWAVDGNEATEEDRRALVYLPVRTATLIFLSMTAITVLIAIPNFTISHRPVEAAGVVIGLFLTGCTIAAILYLQTERALRQLFVLALSASGVPQRRTVGVRPRLVLAWMLGSALPLLFIISVPLRPHTSDLLPLIVPVIYMAVFGLLLGGIITLLAARSVAEPIESVRIGLERVRDGELETELAVTDPGDLGQLQAGFNKMVIGLRERRNLEDLFGRHVGTDVARQAAGSGLELGGEARDVTVLFVDIVGSTAFAESNPPPVVVSRVNELFQIVFDEVSTSGGWINKFEGDGCLCVFGAPSVLPGHQALGLGAARSLGRRLESAGLEVGIGVSSGDVVAGNIGSVERFEYTVMGRPVNQAARLTEAAKGVPGRVLATRRTVDAAGDEGERWEAAGDLDLKGLGQALPVSRPIPERR